MFPTQKFKILAILSCASPRRQSAAQIFTFTTASSQRWKRATSWARIHGSRRRDSGQITALKKGDRVIIPFPDRVWQYAISANDMETALCDTTNPEGSEKMKTLYGQAAAGLFGYSHHVWRLSGRSSRVRARPLRGFRGFKVPEELTDEQVLFLTDIFPPASWRRKTAVSSRVRPLRFGDAGRSASSLSEVLFFRGRPRIALDNVPERLEMAQQGRRRNTGRRR